MGGDTSPEQQYSLRWNDFHSSILSSFRHLRDEEDFVDVTLACDGCSFKAHKVVLSACSPYFRRLLKANPCKHPIVILRDVRQKDMESLLRFMYNGEVHIGQEHLTDFFKDCTNVTSQGISRRTSRGRWTKTDNCSGAKDLTLINRKELKADESVTKQGTGAEIYCDMGIKERIISLGIRQYFKLIARTVVLTWNWTPSMYDYTATDMEYLDKQRYLHRNTPLKQHIDHAPIRDLEWTVQIVDCARMTLGPTLCKSTSPAAARDCNNGLGAAQRDKPSQKADREKDQMVLAKEKIRTVCNVNNIIPEFIVSTLGDGPSGNSGGRLIVAPGEEGQEFGERQLHPGQGGEVPSRGNGDMQESLLGQALEGGPTILTKEKVNSDSSIQAQSTGEDSNSSDTAMSEHVDEPVTPKTEPSEYPMLDDHHPFSTNGGLMDPTRTPGDFRERY
ncbi:hypothetical protein NQ317_008116 [Molorchus minor]|uniref:BTB domain-containing protein n=1 Tax=Molorchus minor TaxID=1323400 RepID=A0ABQ9K2I1_9CUCU|nr:hypothetical protein NQ317_008116 [Molorchus minor]